MVNKTTHVMVHLHSTGQILVVFEVKLNESPKKFLKNEKRENQDQQKSHANGYL
jgi:hypothetical protein